MTLNELLTELRTTRLDDNSVPPFWSDCELVGFLNDAVRQVCLRQRCLTESQNATLCTIPITSGQQLVPLNKRIISVRVVRYIDTQCTDDASMRPLRPTTTRRHHRLHPHWDIEEPGYPEFWIPDYQEGMLAISRPPINAGTLKLLVWRMPLESEELDEADMEGEPVISPHWHKDLLEWCEYRAFSKPDTETFDKARADDAEAKFTAKIGRLPSATEVRLWGVSRAVGTTAEFI